MVALAWKLFDVTWYRALTYCGLGEIKVSTDETWQLKNSNTDDENIDISIDIDIDLDFKVDVNVVDDVDVDDGIDRAGGKEQLDHASWRQERNVQGRRPLSWLVWSPSQTCTHYTHQA